MKIKHISFDVWNTLLISNAAFGAARTQYLAEFLELPVEQVAPVIKSLKKEFDSKAEEAGIGYSTEIIYHRILDEFKQSHRSWTRLRKGVESLFALYQPLVIDEVASTLRTLRERGYTISIASNTNFVRGEILSKVILNNLGVDWLYKIFSDEIQVAKPNERFWSEVCRRYGYLTNNESVRADEILHVGDNPICDGGSANYGLQYLYVSGPQELNRVLERVG